MKFRIPIFRFNKKRKHPSYIFYEKDDKYYSFLITHNEKYKRKDNIMLYKNPNSKDERQSYIHDKLYQDKKSDFSYVFKNWKFDKNDKRKIKRLKKKYKKKIK